MHALVSPPKYSSLRHISRSLEKPKSASIYKDSSGFPKTPIYFKESRDEQWELRDKFLTKSLYDISQFSKYSKVYFFS